ncbi:MAG: putative methyltransferase [Actinomycetota bacterium]|nr:putative methyltransferase [Actinomycetota bacterium]
MAAATQQDRVKVGFVQLNTALDSSMYLPYSVALLQAYLQAHAERPERYVFGLPIIAPVAAATAAEELADVDIVGFSMYVWNANRQHAIARELKARNAQTLVVLGGPHVPDRPEEFLRAHPCVDVVCHGEGEQTFLELAERFPDRGWEDVPGVSFLDPTGRFVTVPKRPRIKDLSIVPSPFLEGVFSPLMDAHPQTVWRTVWETNRGCPFKCTFCDWGSAIAAKVNRFELDRIVAEAEWIAANQIDYVFLGDANFGILQRDIEIAEAIVAAAKRHGAPRQVLIQLTKNTTERAYQTMKTIADAGLATEMNISFQTTTPQVLTAIKRDNISLETYRELQRRFVHDGIPTYVDMIVGLPAETPQSLRDSVSRVVEGGQHHRVQFHNLSVLPNAEMGDPDYQREYGLKTVTTRIVNNHAPAESPPDGIYETQDLVVSAASYSEAGWRDMRSFAWLTLTYHMHRLLQVATIVTWKLSELPFSRVIDALMLADPERCPTLAEMRTFCDDFARRIQRGGDEYIHSEDWLDQFWTVDEYLLIKLCLEDRLADLYAEGLEALAPLLPPATQDLDPRVALEDAVRLNQARMHHPLAGGRALIRCDYDVHAFCEAVLHGEEPVLQRGPITYEVEHHRAGSLDAWLLEIVRDRAESTLAEVISTRRSTTAAAVVGR